MHSQGSEASTSIGSSSEERQSSIPTSTTTPETSETTHLAFHLSTDAQQIVSDLSNYLALGCLCFEDFCKIEADDESGVWKEVKTVPVLAFDQSISSHLSRLLENGWIRMQVSRGVFDSRWLVFRVYFLFMDIGMASIDRSNKRLLSAIQSVLPELDVSKAAWQGEPSAENKQTFDMWATADEDNPSLFYVFNKLPSPAPSPAQVHEKYAREAVEDLLDGDANLPGLKTCLYPYQRRSASAMLQREATSKLEVDPRLERRVAPDDSTFYYGARDTCFLRDARYYETCKGGILAESPGTGKTLMVLALILATKNHPPKVPIEYATRRIRSSVATLTDMAVAAVNQSSFPWRVERDRIQHHREARTELGPCFDVLERNPPSYEIPVVPIRWNRKTTLPPPHSMTLTATTIIVVPQNLFGQWRSEIFKHVEQGSLNVLYMDDRKKPLPSSEEIRSYDIILFTRNRFDLEIKDGEDDEGRRLPHKTATVCRCPYIGSTRQRDCRCLKDDMLYVSPLKHLHFKRIVVDEGHFFSNSNTATISVVNRLITADHRWSVSGTPARDLMGVEVHMSAMADIEESKDEILERRKHFSPKQDKTGAIESLGSLASTFLKIDPWCYTGSSSSSWRDYVFRHEDHRRNTFSGFSTCLRRTLENIVVKTQPEDVERDIELPPLSHKIVRLEPSFYDKLTANLFTLVLTANAITSERTDADYLFHKNSSRARYQLLQNLRQSAFFWTGFSTEDVLASVKTSTGYLAKEGINCTEEDRQLMLETLASTETILGSSGWKSLSESHELGVYIYGWPVETAEHWAYDSCKAPLLTGISHLLEAQSFVNHRLGQEDPGEGLAGAGIKALASLRAGATEASDNPKRQESVQLKARMPGIPTSSIDGEPLLRRGSLSKKIPSPKKNMMFRVTKAEKASAKSKRATKAQDNAPSAHASSIAPEHTANQQGTLSPDSPYARARVVGTASAKMSYLISQIVKHYEHEKILVFYSGDNIAYYIAQMLELLHINHEIYAKSLQNRLKSEYVVKFDQGTHTKVLLMDVNQAAFGLNLSSASRIYFVNPVCRPNVEAQAIKRAHRIGQTRNVVVETLVLRGTIEEKMLERANNMSTDEHRDAKVLEDDGGIREIIQSARIIPTATEQHVGRGQMAPIEEPQQLWARSGWNRQRSPNSHEKRKRDSDELQGPAKKQRTTDAININVSNLREGDSVDARNVPWKTGGQCLVDATDRTILNVRPHDSEDEQPIPDSGAEQPVHGIRPYDPVSSKLKPQDLTLTWSSTCKETLAAIAPNGLRLGVESAPEGPATGMLRYECAKLGG